MTTRADDGDLCKYLSGSAQVESNSPPNALGSQSRRGGVFYTEQNQEYFPTDKLPPADPPLPDSPHFLVFLFLSPPPPPRPWRFEASEGMI